MYKALQLAFGEEGRPVTVSEVRSVGEGLPNIPETKLKVTWYTPEEMEQPGHPNRPGQIRGGHTPFGFDDRARGWLKRLVSKGLAVEDRTERVLRFYPTRPWTDEENAREMLEYRLSEPHVGIIEQKADRFAGDYPELTARLQEIGGTVRRDESLRTLFKTEGLD